MDEIVKEIAQKIEDAVMSSFDEIPDLEQVREMVDSSSTDQPGTVFDRCRIEWMKLLSKYASPNLIDSVIDLCVWMESSNIGPFVLGFLSRLPGGGYLEDIDMRRIPDNIDLGWKELQLLTNLLNSIEYEKDIRIAIAIIMSSHLIDPDLFYEILEGSK